jgi:hypothetical protein
MSGSATGGDAVLMPPGGPAGDFVYQRLQQLRNASFRETRARGGRYQGLFRGEFSYAGLGAIALAGTLLLLLLEYFPGR